MIDCLVGYIGLKSISATPTGGKYVNDLAGITTEHFETVREISENQNALTAWQTLEKRAIELFEMDIMSRLKKYFKNYTHLSAGVTGFVDDNDLANHGSGKYAGWLFDLNSYSENIKLVINDVKINLASAENFTLKIFDANTGLELFTKDVVGVEGLQVVKILEEFSVYEHNKIFVAYDTVIPYRVFNEPTVPGSISQGSISTSSAVLAENIDSTENGLMVSYSAKCGIDNFVCSRMALFSEPFLIKLGIEFLKYSKYSDTLNRFTLLNTPDDNELIEDYKLQYIDQLDAILTDIEVPDDGICFICNKAFNQKAMIP